MKNVNDAVKLSAISILICSFIYGLGRFYSVVFWMYFGAMGNVVFGSVFISALVYGFSRYHLK